MSVLNNKNKTTIILHGTNPAVTTASHELADALTNVTLDRLSTINLGMFEDLPNRIDLIRRGIVNLHNVPPGKDAFECLYDSDTLYLLGSTPRGVLHAVYTLEEHLVFGRELTMDWHLYNVFRIGQRHFHPRFDKWPGERADIRYLSRLGASHCLISHDWQGSLRSFQGYVTSPIFPNAVPLDEVNSNRAGLKQLIINCRDYGLGLSLWITELPCQGGPWVPEPKRQEWLDRYPSEVLSDSGTYQGKVLCFSHPLVQAFYRDLLVRFFSEFPEIETVYLFGMDSGGEGCDSASCTRCKGISKFEQRDRLIRFLIEEGGKVRPGLRVLTTGWHWERMPDQFLERQNQLPAASGLYMAAQCDGWQAERQNHDLLRRARTICREQGQLFIGYDDFHLGDDATFLWGLDLQDFPLGVGAKIARWYELDADGVFDHWGTYNETIPNNSVACREFFLNPLTDPETICHRIALNQYGSIAGEIVFRAWQAIERAHRILSNCTVWHGGQWPNWYNFKASAPLPEFLANQSTMLNADRLGPKNALGFTYNDGDLSSCLEAVAVGWRLAATYFAEATRLLKEVAVEEVPVGYAFWWNGVAVPLNRSEHLARHCIYIEYMGLLGREIGLHFELQALFERLGQNADAYLAAAGDLLREDRDACESIVAFCERLLRERPEAGKLTGAKWHMEYRRKIDQLNAVVCG